MTSKILYSWSKLRHDFLKKKQKLYLQKNRINYGPLLILTNCLRKTEKCYSSDFNPKFVTRNKKLSKICFLAKSVFSDETEGTYKGFVNLTETEKSLMRL